MANNKEFLTFRLHKEEFAVEINRVQEIRGWQEPRPLPSVPDFVLGVMDLRGMVVPVIDLRHRFGLKATYNVTTVIIVVHVMTSTGERVFGMVVDAVSDVHNFSMDSLQPPPDISNSVDTQFILGLSTIYEGKGQTAKSPTDALEGTPPQKGRMVIIIDIDLLASEGLVEQITQSGDAIPLNNG